MKRNMESYGHAFPFFFFFFFFFFFCVDNATVNSNQRYLTQNDDMQTMRALSKLLPADDHYYWSDASTGSSDPCTWRGVSCTATSHSSQVINALSLFDFGLPANITDTSWSLLFFDLLCQLNSLQSLDLSYNHFTYIPTSFLSNCSGLSQLKSLDLSLNSLAGTLGNFSSFPALETLDLSYNLLRGEIPASLASVTSLQSFVARHNKFVGTIPAGISKHIKTLDLSYNMLTGGISSGFPGLETLDLSYNQLGGHVGLPTNITDTSSSSLLFFDLLCQLNSLQSLDLSNNHFTYIPTSFLSNCSGLSQLKSLDLSLNSLAGTLGNFSSFPALETLDLSYNRLGGHVGVHQLHGLANLKTLDLSHNLFDGTIPPLSVYEGLQELVLSNNNFSGRISNDIFKLKNLTLLDLSANSLSGSIPDGCGELSKLGYLKLSYNHLTGGISFDLLSPPTLFSVDLSYNLLQGAIPANISSGLNNLRLSGNSLVGTIPATICSLNTNSLELDNNKLDGQIPPQLGNCQNLALLNLTANRLQGELPKELGNITNEQLSIYLQDNNLSGEIPKELLKLENLGILDISHNSLTGAIPSEISSLQSLTRLNLEGNKLNGSIPHTIGALGNLIELQLGDNKLNGKVPGMPTSLSLSLNLSSNLLTGPIPSYLDDLQQLQILDLSNNEFTGGVPSSLTQMWSLTLLDLSNNLLSGTPPHFQPSTHVNLTGNKDILLDENKDIVNVDTVARPLDRFAILVMVASFVGGFFVSIVLARIYQEVILRCFYNGKDETSAASRSTTLHEPEPQLVELQNLRRIRRQLDAAAAKYNR